MVNRNTSVGALARLLMLGGALTSLGACGFFDSMLSTPDSADLVAPGRALLAKGDLAGADAAYGKLAAEHPESIHVAVDRAYLQLLAGDYAGADATLAAVEEKAGDAKPEILLRRALVQLRQGRDDLDAVGRLAKASGLPEGKILAAEVGLANLQTDEAMVLFKEVAAGSGAAADVARRYLHYLESDVSMLPAVADGSALWALGDRVGAVDSMEDVLPSLPEDQPERDELLLLWAGRAVTSGRPGVARTLLDSISNPPPGQQWRLSATSAMIALAEGNTEEALSLFAMLEQGVRDGIAPAQGLADARATAAAMAGDPAVALELLGDEQGAAAAMALRAAGADGAASRASAGPLRSYLEAL